MNNPTMLLIDGNNWFRRIAETDPLGRPLSSCFSQLCHSGFDKTIIVWDGFNSRKKRKEIYPEYKAKRKYAGDSLFESQNLFKELAEFSPVDSIEIKETEADDVIASLVKNYRLTYDITIESNDADFLQLGVPVTRRKEFKVEAKDVRLYKTLVGDPSDNISGLYKFGDKKYQLLTEEQKDEILLVLIDKSKDARTLDFLPKAALENLDLKKLRIFYEIVGFIDVPMSEIIANTKAGMNQPHLAQAILKEYMI